MKEWTSWGIVNVNPKLHDRLMAIPGMVDGQDLHIFCGTLGEFCEYYREPFTAHHDGRYIKLETRND